MCIQCVYIYIYIYIDSNFIYYCNYIYIYSFTHIYIYICIVSPFISPNAALTTWHVVRWRSGRNWQSRPLLRCQRKMLGFTNRNARKMVINHRKTIGKLWFNHGKFNGDFLSWQNPENLWDMSHDFWTVSEPFPQLYWKALLCNRACIMWNIDVIFTLW